VFEVAELDRATTIEQFLGGIKLDIASLLETNAILNVRASPIIDHASSKFKYFIFQFHAH
jgi:hypothetical protein